ncbi:hypothetical protein [Paenibacillus pinihumi]|uniref:hypothetical protein n=1 Tax=Paenibacillus pinihumi TaxID=669462 RepID=UPI00040FD9A2|nr:hypothetical protein [Paenibacillus pinihumi]
MTKSYFEEGLHQCEAWGEHTAIRKSSASSGDHDNQMLQTSKVDSISLAIRSSLQ